MTVKELKEELNKYDDNLIVYVPRMGCNMALIAEARSVRCSGGRLCIKD